MNIKFKYEESNRNSSSPQIVGKSRPSLRLRVLPVLILTRVVRQHPFYCATVPFAFADYAKADNL